MDVSAAARRNFVIVATLTAAVSTLWSTLLVLEYGGPTVSQAVSNFGLVVAALAAAGACALAARRDRHHRRVWGLLAGAVFSWGFGQILWTWYESVLGREVPFPSLADVGYLGMIPLAAAALMSLPTGTVSVAGRIRTLLDGVMIAGSLLLTSWVVVLDTVFHAGTGAFLSQAISLAYPMGDVVIATIVLYVYLRSRHLGRAHGFPLGLIGAGLVAFAVADSGFVYLTATGAYASGALIDLGWFFSFALILLAAARPPRAVDADEDERSDGRSLSLLLPYAAVCMALATSAAELLREGQADSVVSWIRTFIIGALVVRQVLTLLENRSLTRRLESRVDELRTSEQRFRGLVQHSSDVVTVIDSNLVVRYQSESVERVFGYLGEALLDRPISDLLDEESTEHLAATVRELAAEPFGIRVLELSVRHRSGRLCAAEMTVTNLLDTPSVGGLVLNTRDISERKSLEEQLVYSAFHDSLTALANRALFRERVDETLSEENVRGRVAILFLDLDGFKQVNDLLGHAAGDLLLVQVAERLRSCVRPNDIVARLGGDEFGILLVEADERIAASAARRITKALKSPFPIEEQEIHVNASVGIAVAERETDGDRLLRNADLAMYRVKSSGGGGFKRYDPDMHVDLVERIQLEADLRRTIATSGLVLHYQPTVVLATGEVTGVEALARWVHPSRGLMPPAQFIPLAEESGLIVPLGRWVLAEACRQAVEWQRAFPGKQLTMSVNISGGQLSPGFDDLVGEILAESGLDAASLILEMTESVLMENSDDNLELFTRLKDIGVGLAIDDFGTGYSSLSYLHRFPVDVLKIDRSFVEPLGKGPHDPALVGTIVKLGQALGMRTIAEGIEEAGQIASLRRFECELGQGYHFARPLPADQAERLLAKGLRPTAASTRARRRAAA
jgi:diguanylate cyclase (GGDEF)-like protein/PAS domain S-box-containing protein